MGCIPARIIGTSNGLSSSSAITTRHANRYLSNCTRCSINRLSEEVMAFNFWLLRAPDAQPLATQTGAKYDLVVCPARDGHQRSSKRIGPQSVSVHPLGIRDF